jgi:hypothetical protein
MRIAAPAATATAPAKPQARHTSRRNAHNVSADSFPPLHDRASAVHAPHLNATVAAADPPPDERSA